MYIILKIPDLIDYSPLNPLRGITDPFFKIRLIVIYDTANKLLNIKLN